MVKKQQLTANKQSFLRWMRYSHNNRITTLGIPLNEPLPRVDADFIREACQSHNVRPVLVNYTDIINGSDHAPHGTHLFHATCAILKDHLAVATQWDLPAIVLSPIHVPEDATSDDVIDLLHRILDAVLPKRGTPPRIYFTQGTTPEQIFPTITAFQTSMARFKDHVGLALITPDADIEAPTREDWFRALKSLGHPPIVLLTRDQSEPTIREGNADYLITNSGRGDHDAVLNAVLAYAAKHPRDDCLVLLDTLRSTVSATHLAHRSIALQVPGVDATKLPEQRPRPPLPSPTINPTIDDYQETTTMTPQTQPANPPSQSAPHDAWLVECLVEAAIDKQPSALDAGAAVGLSSDEVRQAMAQAVKSRLQETPSTSAVMTAAPKSSTKAPAPASGSGDTGTTPSGAPVTPRDIQDNLAAVLTVVTSHPRTQLELTDAISTTVFPDREPLRMSRVGTLLRTLVEKEYLAAHRNGRSKTYDLTTAGEAVIQQAQP